eukprot:CAMPEP_0172567934 /NCGR_PEP_ID=MMETSP1067-20121228/117823_1 /TAXON_ID=265564 ORGANISM="Thalassiosira punctigera, Strain Tpunct2005C2" /NCGR_SAMPLE_ID=MMETSP1067 /ASSEMBLY_ACC=CAM_ASM_000444 /LENGTH=64 /DNA_ID=CAMNT_0013359397 /DNA_START=79 /DNA_END=273 /DNA_ORIENTATION=+
MRKIHKNFLSALFPQSHPSQASVNVAETLGAGSSPMATPVAVKVFSQGALDGQGQDSSNGTSFG